MSDRHQSNVLSPEQVAEMERMLTAHYGEPVRPVSAYCNAFRWWAQALVDRASDEESPRDEALQEIAGLLSNPLLDLVIRKSSMLARLIYGGEALRTEKCPEHKGHWCGLEWDDNRCPHGCNLTGWLPAKEQENTR